MKKLLILITIAISQYCTATTLEIGTKVPLWNLIPDLGNDLSVLDACKDKVMIIYHIDPRHSNENIDAIFAVRDAIADGRLSLKDFQSIGIVDCDATWQPNRMIKRYAERQNKKMPELNSLLLFDYSGTIAKSYNFEEEDNLNCIVLTGKQAICRAIYKKKMSPKQIVELVDMAVNLQNAPNLPNTEEEAVSSSNNNQKNNVETKIKPEQKITVEVGKKLPTWEEMLHESNISYKEQCANKILIINYIDPDYEHQNMPTILAIQQAVEDGRLSLKDFHAIGIFDYEAVNMSNPIILDSVTKELKKIHELNPILLFDIKGIIAKKYKMDIAKNKNYFILTNKQGICMAIYKGQMTKKQIKDLVDMAVNLQTKPYKQTSD